MFVSTYAGAVAGIDAVKVTVEVNLTGGGLGLYLVGLPDNAVKESEQRIRAAFDNPGPIRSGRKVVVSLAPADLRKEGAGFDLPIAVGILAAMGRIDAGAVAARLLFDRLDPGADIVVGRIVHRGDAGSNQWRNREAGFRSYLEAHAFRGRLHYAALRLDDEACNGRVLDEMFRENPSIAGAVTFNSTCYILAGYLAARRRDGVRLVGYDVIRRNGEMLSAGVVTALVAQRPEAQGYRAVMALCEWLVEGRAPSKVNNMPIDILLKENIPYYKNNII